LKSVGRVRNSEPFWARMAGEKGSTGPDALPKLTIKPRDLRQSSDFRNVSFPTES
jgi:hypothetical protein